MKAKLKGANFAGSTLDMTNFMQADLEGAQLAGVKSGQMSIFLEANVAKANLQGSNLRNSIWMEASAPLADFSGCDLRESVWTEADLSAAKFVGATLNHANLSYTKLDGADMTRASLFRADLHGVLEKGTTWSGANLTAVQRTDLERLDAEKGFEPPGPA